MAWPRHYPYIFQNRLFNKRQILDTVERRVYTGCLRYRFIKIHAYVLVHKSFMEFMFSTVYRVTQKDFYARPYTSMWAPVVARQISKRYSSSCHVFISIIELRGLLENDSPTRSTFSSVTCCLRCFPDSVRTVLYLNDIQALAY